ncbi:thiamine phosphate synthase [Planctomycetota bacterium]
MAGDPDPTHRILDANFNRSREALRVLEECARFVLDHQSLAGDFKTLRHELATLMRRLEAGAGLLAASRDTPGDVGTQLSNRGERTRNNIVEVVQANFKRLQESLRALEEYGKALDATIAESFKQLRYQTYSLETACHRYLLHGEALQGPLMVILSIDGLDTPALEIVRAARVTGTGLLQLRMKNCLVRKYIETARQVLAELNGSGTRLLVNDRLDVAMAAGADGAHLGESDMPVALARRMLGGHAIIGASTADIEHARQAAREGADYIGAGAAFATSGKEDAVVRGIEHIAAIQDKIDIPVFAVGGITLQSLPDVAAAGLHHVAVGSDIVSAEDPRRRIESYLTYFGGNQAGI